MGTASLKSWKWLDVAWILLDSKAVGKDPASSSIMTVETSSSDSPDRFEQRQVQEARIALLEHHTSQMQAYVDRGLTFFGAFLALFAVFVQLSSTTSLNPITVMTVFVALGFLCGCMLFSMARFARYGMTVRAVTKAPLIVKENGSKTVLGQLDDCIGEWARKEMASDAIGEWKKKWKMKLWKILFDLGDDQTKSLRASVVLWVIVFVSLVVCWIVLISQVSHN